MFFVTAKVLNAFMELAQIMSYNWNSDGTPLITHAKRVIFVYSNQVQQTPCFLNFLILFYIVFNNCNKYGFGSFTQLSLRSVDRRLCLFTYVSSIICLPNYTVHILSVSSSLSSLYQVSMIVPLNTNIQYLDSTVLTQFRSNCIHPLYKPQEIESEQSLFTLCMSNLRAVRVLLLQFRANAKRLGGRL